MTQANELYGKTYDASSKKADLEKAVKWLDKAVQFDEAGNTAMADRALNAALKAESEAFS